MTAPHRPRINGRISVTLDCGIGIGCDVVLSPIANNTVESFTAELIEHFRDFIEMLEDEETEESINELLFAALENTCTGRA